MGNQQEIEQFDQLLRDQMQQFQPAPPPGLWSEVLTQTGTSSAAAGWSAFTKWIIGISLVAGTATGFFYITKPEITHKSSEKGDAVIQTSPSTPLTAAAAETTSENNLKSETALTVPTEPEHQSFSNQEKSSPYQVNVTPGHLNNDGPPLEPSLAENNPTPDKGNYTFGKSEGPRKNPFKTTPVVAPEFGYQWIDDNRIVLSLKKSGFGQTHMYIQGQMSELSPEDGSIINLDRENFPAQIVFKSNSGHQIDSFVMRIQYEEKAVIPNAFTPDGDGINDVYTILVPSYTVYSIRVLDSGNKLLYEGHAWDGTDSGRPSEAGTYHVLIRYKTPTSGWLSKQLEVQLVRK